MGNSALGSVAEEGEKLLSFLVFTSDIDGWVRLIFWAFWICFIAQSRGRMLRKERVLTKDPAKSLETVAVAVQYCRYRACKPPVAG